MAIFVSYTDEADVGTKEGRFLVSGYVAPESEWLWFSRAWQTWVLDGPPRIPYLHTVEMRSKSFREAHGLSELQAEDRIDEAIRVINNTGCLLGFASIMRKDEFQNILVSELKKSQFRLEVRKFEPDYLCFLGYAITALQFVEELCPEAERVDFVVARKQRVTHHLPSFYNSLERWTHQLLD